MLRRVQILNYRCLRYVDVRLDRFHVLVGANASGKTTFMDALAFVGDLVSDGLEEAVEKRTGNFQDLVWNHPEDKASMGFELALEFEIPMELQHGLPKSRNYPIFRYEVAIKELRGAPCIASERGLLSYLSSGASDRQPNLFPDPLPSPKTILVGGHRQGSRTILNKSDQGKDSFNSETAKKPGGGWLSTIELGSHRSTLGSLPESPSKLPVSTYVKRWLVGDVKSLFLDSLEMRKASPPRLRRVQFAHDGSNLPWAVQRLREENDVDFKEWLDHIRGALPDLEDIRVVERPEDRHAYLMLRYKTGLEVPSWMASDGTLRMLALTILAYLPDSRGIYFLEEPENGIHPRAVETIYQSLSMVDHAQILLASHSPVILSLSDPADILCFAKNEEGATDIISGDKHPRLIDWRHEVSLGTLFASGVLG